MTTPKITIWLVADDKIQVRDSPYDPAHARDSPDHLKQETKKQDESKKKRRRQRRKTSSKKVCFPLGSPAQPSLPPVSVSCSPEESPNNVFNQDHQTSPALRARKPGIGDSAAFSKPNAALTGSGCRTKILLGNEKNEKQDTLQEADEVV